MPLRVIVAADSALLRAGLTRVLQDEGLRVLAQAPDAAALVREAAAHRPDVVVLSLAQAPRREQLPPGTGVLALAQRHESAMALLDAGPAGVGVLVENHVPDVARFVAAVREVAGGGSVLDPEIVGLLVDRRSRGDALTEREREVLELMAQGRSNRAIASTVYLSERGVERHITAIFDKLRLPASRATHRRVLAVLAHHRTSTAVA